MYDVRDNFHPSASKGFHDVCGVFVRGWAEEIRGPGDGVRLDCPSMDVHEFDVRLAADEPLIGIQAGRKALEEGFRGGVERKAWESQFRGE